MKTILFSLFLLVWISTLGQPFKTRFEQSNGTESPTYPEVIQWWKKLDAAYPTVKMMEMGPTDAGYPLHLILVSTDKIFDIKTIKLQKKAIVFINNGIHPGEPDGIDASMLLVRDIVQGKYKLPSHVVLALIPVYNIGGALNRSVNYRIDQNGPVEKGFRGNGQNLDLNRDFIKCDTKNARSFTQIFHLLDPDIFIDNHVSNGADYQHVMTLLSTQKNKLGGALGDFLNQQLEPAIYASMKEKGYDLVPYVNHFGNTPDKGWAQFWDSPRYSSGYAALWGTLSFMPETHMLKPYAVRVKATYALMQSFLEFAAKNGAHITQLRAKQKKAQLQQKTFPIVWKWEAGKSVPIAFKGFEAGYKTSNVSGLSRLYYDRSKPLNLSVPFFNSYADSITVQTPEAYVIPQGWWKVIDLLKLNGVQLRRLSQDSTITVEVYRIEKYNSSPRPFEGHHPNSGVQVSSSTQKIPFRKGDYYIPLHQTAIRFLLETLEPQAEDSYFAWNFFDPILGQKEGISDYVFEETATAFLKEHPEVQKKLEERKAADAGFAKNGAAQLNFVFQNSPYFEPAYLQYPVYRVVK